VVLLVAAALLGAVIGRLRRPAGQHAIRARLHRPWLLAGGVALQLAATIVDDDLRGPALALSLAILVAFAVANRHLTGVAVMGVGLLLNLTVVVLNEGMPVRGEALVRAGLAEHDELAQIGLAGARHLETDRTLFPILGDVVPLRLTGHVVSFGDLILLAGLVDVTALLAVRRRPAWSAARRESYASRPAPKAITSPVQDWGAAPDPAPVSASQCSAHPDDHAPAVTIVLNERATSDEPDLVAATHDR
jgi:hypothetical protein